MADETHTVGEKIGAAALADLGELPLGRDDRPTLLDISAALLLSPTVAVR